MYHHLLPISIILLLTHVAAPVWSAATLIPPSTFADPPSSTPTISGSNTGSIIITSASASATGSASITKPPSSSGVSANASSTATPTTTQFPPLNDVPTCVTNSLATAISRVQCTSIVDVNCFCPNPNFPAELLAYILANCPDQVSAAEDLAQKFCNVATVSRSLSFAPLPTTTPASDTVSLPSTTAPPSTTPTSTPSSAARGMLYPAASGPVIAAAGTALGLVLGASFVL